MKQKTVRGVTVCLGPSPSDSLSSVVLKERIWRRVDRHSTSAVAWTESIVTGETVVDSGGVKHLLEDVLQQWQIEVTRPVKRSMTTGDGALGPSPSGTSAALKDSLTGETVSDDK